MACNLKNGPFFVYDQTSYKKTVETSQHNHLMFSGGTIFFSYSTNNIMSQNSLNNYDMMVGNTFPLNTGFNGSLMNTANFSILNVHSNLSQLEAEDTSDIQGTDMHIADL